MIKELVIRNKNILKRIEQDKKEFTKTIGYKFTELDTIREWIKILDMYKDKKWSGK